MRSPKKWFWILIVAVALASSSCSGNNENAHTTATTFVSPPPRQVLKAESRPVTNPWMEPVTPKKSVDVNKPILFFTLPHGKTFRESDEVLISFVLVNAKLKGDGGEYRVRYIVDDDEMQWIDRYEQVALTGWIAGKHTIRMELVGPDGWPYRNGDYNIETREITIIKS